MIPVEAVEAAAAAIQVRFDKTMGLNDLARATLEAAAPIIHAKVAEDILEGLRKCAPDDIYAIGFLEGYTDASRDVVERGQDA